MHKTLLTAWPLFFGISMIMIGSGLQSTLLGVRATMEGFPTYTTGIIMSMYYAGFMAGSHFTPMLIRGVGHIRVFAALASVASTTVLIHGLLPNEEIWAIARAITGFSYAGLYIVIESWLNNAATNKTRGKMMALYLVVLYGSMALGQYLLLAADPKQMDLFVITSILVSLALLPISLSSRPAPHFDKAEKVSLKLLFKSSPLGVFTLFTSGMAAACLFSMSPVYATSEGFTLAQTSTFMALTIFGGVVFQFPIGWLSDKYDRRKVLIGVAIATAASCAMAVFLSAVSIYALYFAMFMIGGTSLTIYGLASAHTNDHLTPAQTVAASATMIMVNGVGSIVGPILSSTFMNMIAPWMLFVTMGCIYSTIAIYGIYRTTQRPSVPLDQQGHQGKFVAHPTPSNAIVMQQVAEQSTDMLKSLKSN